MSIRTLQGKLSSADMAIVEQMTPIRFKNFKDFETPEALILHEHGLLDDVGILNYIEAEVGRKYETPKLSYIPKEIVEFYSAYDVVPVRFDNISDTMYLATLYEFRDRRIKNFSNFQAEYIYVPIHWYVDNYTRMYSAPQFLFPLSDKDIFDSIVSEAVTLGAADITITTRATAAKIFYNVRKKNRRSKRVISKSNVSTLCEYVALKGNRSLVDYINVPRYFSVNLDTHNRGRVVVVNSYHGKTMTIRVLPNSLFEKTLESLNLGKNTIKFMRTRCMSWEPGLRIFIGPTFSGKNTTIASALFEMLGDETKKGVSVEQPVELLMDFLDQLDSETDEEFEQNVDSLLRQNPDLAYITEMTDRTAVKTLNVGNTGKVVYTALHANSVADAPARLQDLTGLSIDRILLNIHSLVFQELVRDEEADKIYPQTRCVYFSVDLKRRLAGKSLSEVTEILREEEMKWVD